MSKKKVLSNIPVFLVKSTVKKPNNIKMDLVRSVLLQTDTLEDPEDIYSAPLKCGYDPYTGEWEEWSTNPLKQKTIQFYGMEDLVKKPSK